MNTYMIDSIKVCMSEAEIVNIAVEFLSDGRSMSECRGYLLNEFDLDADDLGRPLAEAHRQVRACEAEFGSRLKFSAKVPAN